MADIIAPERRARAGGPGLSYWLGTKIVNQPLAMDEGFAGHLQQALKTNAFDAQFLPGPEASKFIGTRDIGSRYRVTDDGIALVPISGVLLDRGEWLGDFYGWATSYEGLAEQCRRLAKDPAIKSVVLDIDSGGGMVGGLYDFCAELEKLKKRKKVYAVAANMAASAAYAIGCVAHEVYVTRTGILGSIGVIAIHTSYQRMLDQAGLDTTIICRGAHKADGNPYQQLSHGARAEMAAMIDRAFEQFVAHVAKHREMDAADVAEMESRVYSGKLAVDAGLADGVKSFEEVLEHIRKGASSGGSTTPKNGGRTVSEANQPGAERPDYDQIIATALSAIAAQRPAAAAAPAPQAPAAAGAPASAAGASAGEAAKPDVAKARIKAILGCEAAKPRQALAHHLALETDLDVAQCTAILGAAPEEKTAASPSDGDQLGDALARRMAQSGSSAGIKPDAGNDASQRPSLASRVKDRFPSKKKGV